MAYAIEIERLSKRFGDVAALSDVDLRVEEASIHGLLGPNGAGKSTMLRILFGLVRADTGRVSIFGREHEADGTAETLRAVAGFVDRPHFYPYLSARRNLEVLAAVDGHPRDAPVDEVLATTGLADVAERRVSGWSTGMLQRLGLASALLRRPRLLILDEPAEGLDPAGARQLDALIRRLAADGATILLSSHNMAEVDAICDTATILHRGSVACHGTLDALRAAAPSGRHRLTTSDDAATLVVGRAHPIDLHPDPRGGFLLEGGAADIHDFVCDLGRRGISVVSLVQEISPLTALFHQLTESGVTEVAAV